MDDRRIYVEELEQSMNEYKLINGRLQGEINKLDNKSNEEFVLRYKFEQKLNSYHSAYMKLKEKVNYI